MPTKNGKKKQDYPVREPNADDTLTLFGIIGATGIDGAAGQAIGVAVAAWQSDEPGADRVMLRAATEGIMGGIAAALRDRETRHEAREFIYDIWQPKLSLGEGESYEDAKALAWKKLPMDAPLRVVDAFRKTDNFSDFLAFFSDMLPKTPSPEDQTGRPGETSSTGS